MTATSMAPRMMAASSMKAMTTMVVGDARTGDTEKGIATVADAKNPMETAVDAEQKVTHNTEKQMGTTAAAKDPMETAAYDEQEMMKETLGTENKLATVTAAKDLMEIAGAKETVVAAAGLDIENTYDTLENATGRQGEESCRLCSCASNDCCSSVRWWPFRLTDMLCTAEEGAELV